MTLRRQRVEDAIERLIGVLDQYDGDTDFEPEEVEEQHDAEAELTWTVERAPSFFVLAERARRKARLH